MILDLSIAGIAEAKRAHAELRKCEAALAIAIQASETERRSAVAKRDDLLARATAGEEIGPAERAAATAAIGDAEAETAKLQDRLNAAVAATKAAERKIRAVELGEELRRRFPDAQARADAMMRRWRSVEAELAQLDATTAAE